MAALLTSLGCMTPPWSAGMRAWIAVAVIYCEFRLSYSSSRQSLISNLYCSLWNLEKASGFYFLFHVHFLWSAKLLIFLFVLSPIGSAPGLLPGKVTMAVHVTARWVPDIFWYSLARSCIKVISICFVCCFMSWFCYNFLFLRDAFELCSLAHRFLFLRYFVLLCGCNFQDECDCRSLVGDGYTLISPYYFAAYEEELPRVCNVSVSSLLIIIRAWTLLRLLFQSLPPRLSSYFIFRETTTTVTAMNTTLRRWIMSCLLRTTFTTIFLTFLFWWVTLQFVAQDNFWTIFLVSFWGMVTSASRCFSAPADLLYILMQCYLQPPLFRLFSNLSTR